MNRKDQNLISNLYLENINQFGAKSASSEKMADMLAKNPAANQPMETEYSIEAPEGYEVSYDGDTLTVTRNLNGVKSTSMTRMGKKSIEEVQRHVDNQVAYDKFVSKSGGGAGLEKVAAAKRDYLRQKAERDPS